MQVKIVNFPETRVAALEHHGPAELVPDTSRRFIEWRKANGISPASGETYGIHYNDTDVIAPEEYRLDICVSTDADVEPNPQGVITKIIPGGPCAVVRHHGSREYIEAADALYRQWLPESGRELRDCPMFFHYVNVGPGIPEHELITDIYLPVK